MFARARRSPPTPGCGSRLRCCSARSAASACGRWWWRCRAVQAEFGVARADASLPYTLAMVGFGAGGVLIGRLVDRFGIVLPVIGGTLLLGLAFVAAGFAPTLVAFAVAQPADRGGQLGHLRAAARRHLALVHAAPSGSRSRSLPSGNYLGGAVWPPIVQRLIEAYGLAHGPYRRRHRLYRCHAAAGGGAASAARPAAGGGPRPLPPAAPTPRSA